MKSRTRWMSAIAVTVALAAVPADAGADEATGDKAQKKVQKRAEGKSGKKAPAPAPPKIAGAKADFVGSQACAKCHAEEFKSWKESFHAKMVRTPQEGFLKDAHDKWDTDGVGTGPTTGNGDGKKYQLSDVKLVVGGGKWKQRYLVTNSDTGGLQFMNRQFNRVSGKWENYGNKNDWNTECATCHSTGYRITQYDPAKPKEQKSEYVELSIGCEACHGPGAKHAKSKKKADIWNVAHQPVDKQSLLCSYCHVRVENEQWKSAQGNPREDLPAPKVGDTHLPWQDWTTWYPEHLVAPGLQKDDPIDKEYPGDLKGMFKLDDVAKADGVFEETKHHQEYQGFIQSAHFKSGELSCITCHSPHAGKGKLKKVAADACKTCHDASYTPDKYMPNTGKTADNLFVRSHTFKKNPRPSSGPGATGQPIYYE